MPPGALASPAEALGLVVRSALQPGTYLSAAQLRPPGPRKPRASLGGGRRPVELLVSGAGALRLAGGPRAGAEVDVVVTSEPRGGGPGRTYLAARSVPLLDLRQSPDPAGAGTAAATLGLTRRQALRLIAAESFARKLTLLAGD